MSALCSNSVTQANQNGDNCATVDHHPTEYTGAVRQRNWIAEQAFSYNGKKTALSSINGFGPTINLGNARERHSSSTTTDSGSGRLSMRYHWAKTMSGENDKSFRVLEERERHILGTLLGIIHSTGATNS